MNSLVKLINISKSFNEQKILENANIEFPNKGLFFILGDSGSGKTTLLNIIAGLDKNYEGTCLINNKNLKKLSSSQIENLRINNIGYVYQNFNLLELENCLNNVTLPLEAISNETKEIIKQKGKDLLNFVGIKHKEKRIVNTLSGGEKQRVAIARALVNDPDILLADEPTGSLDDSNSDNVFKLLKKISTKKLVLVVTHDKDFAWKYADNIVLFKENKLQLIQGKGIKDDNIPSFSSLVIKKKKERTRLGFLYLLRHSFHIMKEKKIRSLISLVAISLGLVGIGLSTYISSSISDEIKKAFSSIVIPNQLIMSPQNNSSLTIGNVYSASLDLAEDIERKFPSEIKGYGSSFLYPFEEMFPDSNEFYLSSYKGEMFLPNFSVRLLNDVLWLDEYEELEYFPSIDLDTSDGEFVVGIPFYTMANICNYFGIEPGFAGLGDFLRQNDVKLLMYLDNYEWGFEDQEIFTIKAITQTRVPTLFTSNHNFAHEFFINQLQFYSSDLEGKENPQNIYEVPYVVPYANASSFLKKAREYEEFKNLVFDSSVSTYLTSVTDDENSMNVKRIYIFECDKNNVGFDDIKKVKDEFPNIVGYFPCSAYGYYGASGSIMTGFNNKFFMAKDEDKLDEVLNAYSILDVDKAFLPLQNNLDVCDANYLSSSSSGLRLSPDFSNLVRGRKPVGIEEICLSTSLGERWNYPEEILIACETDSKIIGDIYERTFKKTLIKVVGYINEDHDTFYANSNWTYDYLIDGFEISPFKVEPNGAIFYFSSLGEVKDALNKLEKKYSNYSFFSPSLEIENSTETVSSYVGNILLVFSFIALIISALVFIIVLTITIFEKKNEEKIFHTIGLGNSDVRRLYISFTFLYCFGSLLIGCGTLLISIFGVKIYLANSFMSKLDLNFPLTPFIYIIATVAIFFLIICLFTLIKVRKKH